MGGRTLRSAARRGVLLVALLIGALLLPSAAQAAPVAPVLQSVGESDHHLTATWTPGAGAGDQTYFIEWADTAYTDAEGYFVGVNYLDFEDIAADQSPFTSTEWIPGGAYFLHVGTYEASCDPTVGSCPVAFSVPSQFAVIIAQQPPAPPASFNVGQSSRHLTASWTLQPWMAALLVEWATRPSVDVDGFFIDWVDFYETDFDQTSFVSPLQLAPGTYYVHVAAASFESNCYPTQQRSDCLQFSPVLPVSIPSDPSPFGSMKPAPVTQTSAPPDKTTAFSALKATAKQDVDKLVVQCSMAEAGTVSASGTVSVPGVSKVFKFKTVSANAAPGAVVKLKLKLPSKALKAVKKALKRKKRLKAKLTITAKDKAGNTKLEKKTVALKP